MRPRKRPPAPPFDAAAVTPDTSVALSDGVRMPVLGLGGGIFGGGAEEAVLSALRLGYRLVDTSPKYNTEAAIGRALVQSGLQRDEVFLSSKVCCVGFAATLKSFEHSLAALRTDYLDLLLMHSGVSGKAKSDPRSPMHAETRAETWRAMVELRKAGRVRAVGVCNFSVRQLRQLSPSPAVVQIEFHPLLQQWDTLRFCREHGIIVQGYGNGGGGWKLWRKHPELEMLQREPFLAAARTHGKCPHQISLRWSIEHGLCVIPKAANPEHQADNRAGVFDFRLNSEEVASLNALSARRSVYNFRDPKIGRAHV